VVLYILYLSTLCSEQRRVSPPPSPCYVSVTLASLCRLYMFASVLRIQIRIRRIHMILGLLDPDPDPLVRVVDQDPDTDPSIIKQK
jgi:hypothetical protein